MSFQKGHDINELIRISELTRYQASSTRTYSWNGASWRQKEAAWRLFDLSCDGLPAHTCPRLSSI